MRHKKLINVSLFLKSAGLAGLHQKSAGLLPDYITDNQYYCRVSRVICRFSEKSKKK